MEKVPRPVWLEDMTKHSFHLCLFSLSLSLSFFFCFSFLRLLHVLCRVLAEEIPSKPFGSKDDADEFTNDFRFYVNQHALSRIYMTNESRFAWRLNFREESLQQPFSF